MTTKIYGGNIVSGDEIFRSDILIEGEKILQIGENLAPADREIDASGKLIFPGFIDAHTHFDFDVSNTTTADNFESGTSSALFGGTTTVIDFACPDKGESLFSAYERWQKKAQHNAKCDYRFHMTVCDWNENISKELEKMKSLGISSFKMYMCYDSVMIDDSDMLNAILKIKELGGIAAVHCENRAIVNSATEKIKADGEFDSHCHPISRPDIAEAEAVSRLCHLAEYAETPIMIVHLSSKAGLEAAREARARGVKVYIETCPQYLALDDEIFANGGIGGALAVCSPPIRKKADCKALWEAIASEEINTVCTDHCSFTEEQKRVGLTDFCKIPGGLPGVETRGILTYGLGVSEGKIPPETMCKILSENVAKIYGIYPQKGVIAVGSDADLVIVNKNKCTKITAKTQHSRANYTPYEGIEVQGAIETVLLRGEIAIEDGVISQHLNGKYVK